MSVQHLYECIIINPTSSEMKTRSDTSPELRFSSHRMVAENVDLDPGLEIGFQQFVLFPGIGLSQIVCQCSLKILNAVLRELLLQIRLHICNFLIT